MAESIDRRMCEIHRTVITNKLNLVTNNLQQLQDDKDNGDFIQTFSQGEVIYTVSCVKIPAIARNLEGICCDEMPIFIQDPKDGSYSKEAYMEPFTRRLSHFCNFRFCNERFPAMYNISNATDQMFYLNTNGSLVLTDSAPPLFDPEDWQEIQITQVVALDVYNKEQRDQITDIIQNGQARNAVSNTFTIGILHTMKQYLPQVINGAKSIIPPSILSAAETFFSQSPLAGILSRLPRYIQTGITVSSH